MDEILKNVIFYGPHMPGVDLNPVRENVEQFQKTDLVQPTPNLREKGDMLSCLEFLNSLIVFLYISVCTVLVYYYVCIYRS